MLTKKIIISALRHYLKKEIEKKDPDTQSYLDFMNTGVFVDLERIRKPILKLVDKVITSIERTMTNNKQ